MTIPESMKETNDKLGFAKIIELIQEMALSTAGKSLANTILPLKDIEMIRCRQSRINALQAILSAGDSLPLNSFSDFRAELDRCRVIGTFLSLETLIQIDQYWNWWSANVVFRAQRPKLLSLEELLKVWILCHKFVKLSRLSSRRMARFAIAPVRSLIEFAMKFALTSVASIMSLSV